MGGPCASSGVAALLLVSLLVAAGDQEGNSGCEQEGSGKMTEILRKMQ